MDSPEFIRRKALGTSAETLLRDLLTDNGAMVTCNQVNRDATHAHSGAAIAHVAGGTLHLPDLTAFWPSRRVARDMHFECKAKSPLSQGGFGWDRHAYERACAWAELTGHPVFYAVRDLSAAPLPAPGQLDDPNHWWVASTWKLITAPTKSANGPFLFWSLEDFTPLPALLENLYDAALVPVIWLRDGPPIVL